MQKSHVIAEMLDQSRKFNRFYISKLDPERVHERYEMDGVQMNSAYWIIGHLGWAELGVVVETCGGPALDIPWIEDFRIGKQEKGDFQGPSLVELMTDLERIHQHSLDFIRSQSDEDLEIPAYLAPARWDTVRRKVFYHAIRHESFHTGQLSWIAKVHGSKMP